MVQTDNSWYGILGIDTKILWVVIKYLKEQIKCLFCSCFDTDSDYGVLKSFEWKVSNFLPAFTWNQIKLTWQTQPF